MIDCWVLSAFVVDCPVEQPYLVRVLVLLKLLLELSQSEHGARTVLLALQQHRNTCEAKQIKRQQQMPIHLAQLATRTLQIAHRKKWLVNLC